MQVKRKGQLLNKFFILILLMFIAGSVYGGTQAAYYISPDGNDATGNGSKANPWKTFTKARDVVRTINDNMTGDIVVYLRGGWYYPSSGITLDDSDSGSNGYKVVYSAYPYEQPVTCGGIQVTGWQQVPGSSKWKAQVTGLDDFRQIYVDDVRALRAKGPVKAYTGFYTVGGENKGLIYSASDIDVYSNPEDMELYHTRIWNFTWMPVKDMWQSGNDIIIEMDLPSFEIATTSTPFPLPSDKQKNLKFFNSLDFVDDEGEWYLDKGTDWLYYIPRDGEDMNTAEVFVPQVENLFVIEGSSSSQRVHDIELVGLTFCYDNWTLTDTNGYFAGQGASIIVEPNCSQFTLGGHIIAPAMIDVAHAYNINIIRNRITHGAGIGISLWNDVNDCLLIGNIVHDVSASGITLSHPELTYLNDDELNGDEINQYDEGHHGFPGYIDDEGVVDNIHVLNNLIKYIGPQYPAGCGFHGFCPGHIKVNHNYVTQISYQCLNLGWEKGEKLEHEIPYYCTDNQLNYNYGTEMFFQTQMGKVGDGGAYHTPGRCPSTEINYNYFDNKIYFDNWVFEQTAIGNVIDRDKNPIISCRGTYIYVSDTWYNTPDQYDATIITDDHEENYFENPHWHSSAPPWPSGAQSIIDNAGIESGYQFLFDWLADGNLPTPQDKASNPNPGSGDDDVDMDVTLTWLAGQDATSHEVYFGTDSTPDSGEFQGQQGSISFEPSSLAGDTVYYWRIDEVSSTGTTTGDVWSFNTGTAPSTPGQASNPSPSDGATGVSVTADLSWTAGSGATSHDVYFGTTSPGTSQGNQTATTYDLGTMSNNTTYYWRINEVNSNGTTTGNVWSFTTESATAPGQASSPSPSNGATGVSLTADLNWTAGSGATSHDVYFGTTSPGASQGNQTTTTYDTGTMDVNTTYYWLIDEVNAQGTTTGNVWSFTTGSGSDPNLVGWWMFDEGSGTATADSSGNENSGTLDDPNWSSDTNDGSSNSLDFNGDGDIVEVADSCELQISGPITLAAWIKLDAYPPEGSLNSSVIHKGVSTGDYALRIAEDGTVDLDLDGVGKKGGNTSLSLNTWHHIAATWDGSNMRFYLDGDPDGVQSKTGTLGTSSNNLAIGGRLSKERDIDGHIDNARVYSRQLSDSEIAELAAEWYGGANPPGQASNPGPSDGATNVDVNADLSWSAGSGATSHDVYFGTTSPGASQGNQTATTYDTGTMTNDTTYYWRIDEVNAEGTTTGSVWSFTTIATPPDQALYPSPSNGAAGVSIDAHLSWEAGSGATSHDVYFGTTSPGASQGNQTDTTYDTVMMEYDTTYYWRIDEVNAGGTTTGSVWSFTTEQLSGPARQAVPARADGATSVSTTADLSWTAGSGATSHDVYFGTTSPGASQDNQTSTTYDTGTMANSTTYYWRINEVNAGGTTTGTVWSFTTEALAPPGQASSPSPADGATSVSTTADLSWRAGSGATSHDVYFGTTSPGASQGNQTSTTYDTGTMANDTTYYWRINEVNAGGTTTGTVWSFTTESGGVDPNLVGHWEFEEGSDGTTADSSGNGNTGTLGSPTWTDDTGDGSDYSLDFNDNDVVDISDSAELRITGDITLTAWVKGDVWTGETDRSIVQKGSSVGYYSLKINGAGGQVKLHLEGVGKKTGSTAVPLNEWHHVAGTWDGSTMRVYLDGSPDGSVSKTGTIDSGSNDLAIGGRPGNVRNIDGTIDNVRVYNRVLNDQEISDLYDAGG